MHRTFLIITALLILFFFPACRKAQEIAPAEISYPPSAKVDQVDDYFGILVPDPYRWMEDDTSEEVKQWVEAQNSVTFAYLDKIPYREKIRQRLDQVYDYPRYSAPSRAGEYYFFTKNDGLQNQSVIYVQKGLDGEPEVFIDPNALSPDGTVRVRLADFSNDDRYAAVTRSEAGSDWQEIRVMEIPTKTELTDLVRWVKFTGTAWYGDGFFYSGYEKPEEGRELTEQNQYQRIYYHRLGDPQEKDELVYEDRAHPLRYMWADITEDERFLILSVTEGTHGNELYFRDLASGDTGFRPLITGFEFDSYVIDNVGGRLLVQTNVDCPTYKVVSIDPANPGKEGWVTVIPEKTEVLLGAGTVGGQMFCEYLKDASSRITQHEMDGTPVREIELPGLGSAGGFSGKKEDSFTFYSFTSFTSPPIIYKYDIADGRSELFRKTEVTFDLDDYETRQVFYSSKDGTRVPMFVVHKKGLKLNGRNPAYLYGYGGFNASETPYFDSRKIVLLENGVVVALANLRGGGEYGEEWHRAGMLLKKQNVFDDFIAAAEYLISGKYTSADRLAIGGASNGGLLVGACITQRPDLFKVALPAVGVMDMLRYHKFTVGWGWAVEYGSSDNEEDFRNLYSYSPLHNIKQGVSYPATLVTTADHDDRVVPAHSFKFIATLQGMNAGPNPVLIRIETRSGHGSSSLTKALDETADEWAFMFYNLGLAPKY